MSDNILKDQDEKCLRAIASLSFDRQEYHKKYLRELLKNEFAQEQIGKDGVGDFEKFIRLAEKDRTVAALISNADIPAIIVCGRKLGFSFGEENMSIFAKRFIEQPEEMELSDEDLDLAAAGVTWTNFIKRFG